MGDSQSQNLWILMTKALQFKAFSNKDLRELERMIFALYREDSWGEKISRRKIRDTVQELTRHPEKGIISIFRVGEAVVGYSIVITYWSNEFGGKIALIDECYVKPSWRNQGIGTSFIKYVSNAKAAGLKGIVAEVTPVNKHALAFYSRQGFAPAQNRYLFKRWVADKNA
jgi:ribosomal protein S18 acetylase RimI-like enzyme